MTTNDEVGYGKPPKHAQFPKGRSGNPKGRPKGVLNIKTMLDKVMNRTISVTENGRTVRMPYLQVVFNQQLKKAATDSKALKTIMDIRNSSADLKAEIENPMNPELARQAREALMRKFKGGIEGSPEAAGNAVLGTDTPIAHTSAPPAGGDEVDDD